MARTARISAEQIVEAMQFSDDQYLIFGGVWPNNRGTSETINKACVEIGITPSQLKRQFAKVVRDRSGRGVGRRPEEQRAIYKQQLLDVIGDGADIIDAAFEEAPKDILISLRGSNIDRLRKIKDDEHIRACCLILLTGYASSSAKAITPPSMLVRSSVR
jgi:hypothetical protein